MPLSTGEKRGFIAFGVGMLLLMTLVAWLNSNDHSQDEGYPSSYSVQRRGGKAAFLLLQQSGYPVERWEKAPTQLPSEAEGVTLVLAGPESYPRPEEFSSLIRFLLRGGRVVLAGALPNYFVPQSSAQYTDLRVGLEECTPVALTSLTRGGAISQDGDLEWEHTDAAVVHFADKEGKPAVVSYAMSRGQVIWWASAAPLTNSGIRDRGNLDLLLNSVGSSKRILWDEYYHREHPYDSGHRDSPAQMWALAQVGLLGLLVVLTFSRRSGPIVPLVREPRLSPLEFVETLGNVFQRARGTQVAVEIALNRFHQIAARRLGIRGTATPEEVVLAMTQHGMKLPPDVAALVRTSGDAAADTELSEKRALEYVRALNQAMRLLDPPSQKEKRK